MVKANQVIEIYKKIANKDSQGFIESTLKLIKSEQNKNHHRLASSLTKLLDTIEAEKSMIEPWVEEFSDIPIDRDRMIELFKVSSSKLGLNDIVLKKETRDQIQEILKEWKERIRLAKYGMEPVRRILFYGPPGCGKTLCASVLAGEMKIPLLNVKTDILVSSLLGETSVNLRKIFESMNSKKRAILFFDEFDAIAKSRIDLQEHGEIRRSVSNLLNFIENAPPNILIITATNHPKILDLAVWRRFDEVIQFSYPDEEEIHNLIRLKLRNFRYKFKNLENIVNQLNGLSHSNIEHICFDSIKYAIINGNDSITDSIIENKIEEFKKRIDKIKKIKKN